MEGKTDHLKRQRVFSPDADAAALQPDDILRMSREEIAGFLSELAAMQRSHRTQAAELAHIRTELKSRSTRMGDVSGFLPVAYLALDAENRILAANQKAADLLGDHPAMLRGKEFSAFVDPSSSDDVARHLSETVRARGTLMCQLKLLRSDGSRFYAQMNSRPVSRRSTGGACIRTVLTDVSEHRQIIETLGRLAAIVESSDDAIIGKDLENRITSWNAGAERIYGWRAKEVIGRPISLLLPPEDVDSVLTVLEDLKQGLRIDHHVSVHITKDGRPIDVSLSISPLRDADGNISGAATIARDITEKRRAAQAVRASEEHLRTILEAFPDAILQVDVDSKVVWVNKAAAVIGAIVGQRCCDLYAAPHDTASHCAAKSAMLQGQTVTVTFCTTGKDEREVCWENVGVPLQNPEGGPRGALLIARDVTRRTQAERAMIEYQEKLRQQAAELVLAEERQRRKIAVALHDNIIQDLAISMLRVEMLKEKSSSVDRQLIEDFAHTLAKVIDETRSMTFDISSPTLYRLGLVAAVDELLDDFLQTQHGIRYKFQDDGREKPLDPDVQVLLFQSVRELLVNIVKHSEADQVDVCIDRLNGNMRITVSDNGKGFDVDNARLKMHKTGGFGLFSIRERLDYVGGHMDIHSEIGTGSRFTLFAPLKRIQ